MIDKVRAALRITEADLDGEIADAIDGCKADLRLVGVVKTDDDDPLILRAVILYAKAHVGHDDNMERFQLAYDALKTSLTLAGDYNALV